MHFSTTKSRVGGLLIVLFACLCLMAYQGTQAFADEGDSDTAISAQDVTVQASTVPVYRLYLPSNGEHLYTTDANEARTLALKGGWDYEGIGWQAPSSGTPVYRLYNASQQNHLYTTDTNEVKTLVKSGAWTKDNGGKPLFYSGGSISIYRMYNAGLRGLHLLTYDKHEYKVLAKSKWKKEGVKLLAAGSGDSSAALPSHAPSSIAEGTSTIANTSSQYSIEADVKLTGSGSGYHAKILAVTPTAAVSFGLQYDKEAPAPYTGDTSFLIENVASNASGGQTYKRVGYASLGDTYHLMLTVSKDGTVDVYINKTKVGSVKNDNLANQTIALRVEGSARKNGDKVTATFSNIKLKSGGTYKASKDWGTYEFQANDGLHCSDTYSVNKQVVIKGKITGLSSGQDWDNAYGSVSDTIQFVG